jgi:RHS repeat-associated protein
VDLVTDLDGEAYELFLYNPWGEQLHHWSSNSSSWTSPYRFNAKEVDPETGLAYYGARYYQSKLGVWLSVDPLAQKYPSFSPFCHAVNNPAFFVDPNGAESIEFDDIRFRDEHGNLLATYRTSQIDKDVVVKGTGDVGSSPNLNLNTLAESLPDVDVIGVGIIGDFTFAGGASGAIEGVLNLDGIDRGKASTHGVVSGNLGFAGGIAVYGLAMDFVGAKGDSQLTMNDYDGQSFSYSLGLMAGGSIIWSVESEKSIEFYPGQSGANRTWNGVQLYGPIVNLAIPMPKLDFKWSINKTSRIN